jgi:hypothetical protein
MSRGWHSPSHLAQRLVQTPESDPSTPHVLEGIACKHLVELTGQLANKATALLASEIMAEDPLLLAA